MVFTQESASIQCDKAAKNSNQEELDPENDSKDFNSSLGINSKSSDNQKEYDLEKSLKQKAQAKSGIVCNKRNESKVLYMDNARKVPYPMSLFYMSAGKRGLRKWLDDHDKVPDMGNIEELMKHLSFQVEWRSNFEELAKDKELQSDFLEAKVYPKLPSNNTKSIRKNTWREEEALFCQINRRARVILTRALRDSSSFLEDVEQTIVHFIQWKELPSEVEVPVLGKLLVEPMTLVENAPDNVCLRFSIVDSSFHRLLIHTMCQFYGINSKTEMNPKGKMKVLLLPYPNLHKEVIEKRGTYSLCQFLRETRLSKPLCNDLPGNTSRSSECSDGYCLMDFPDT